MTDTSLDAQAQPPDNKDQPGNESLSGRNRAIALIVSLAMFMGILEATVIATALPYMAKDFHIEPVQLSIGITVYLIVSAVCMPLSGWVADRLGARRVFAVSIVAFAISSLFCGLSQNLFQFVIARILQAIAASLMTPVGNLVLLRTTPKHQLVSAMAISTTPALIAPVVGPPLGGFITAYLGWRWIFYINIPLAVLGAIAAMMIIPDLPQTARKRFDVKGFLLTGISMVLILSGLDRLAAHPGQWIMPLGVIILGLGCGYQAVRHARESSAPLVSLTALRHKTFASVMLAPGMFSRLPFMAHAFILPLFLQIGLGFDAFQAGLLLLAQNLGDLVLKPFAGKALRRWGFRAALTYGMAAMMLGIGSSALISENWPFWLSMALLFASGMARSVSFTGMMALTYADVADDEITDATVVNNLAMAMSGGLGISIGVFCLNMLRDANMQDVIPLGDFRITIVVLAAAGMISAWSFTRLPADAGAHVSGQKRHKPRLARANASK